MSSEVGAAVALLVLHHLDDPAAAIVEMKRIVRAGGAILVVDMVNNIPIVDGEAAEGDTVKADFAATSDGEPVAGTEGEDVDFRVGQRDAMAAPGQRRSPWSEALGSGLAPPRHKGMIRAKPAVDTDGAADQKITVEQEDHTR